MKIDVRIKSEDAGARIKLISTSIPNLIDLFFSKRLSIHPSLVTLLPELRLIESTSSNTRRIREPAHAADVMGRKPKYYFFDKPTLNQLIVKEAVGFFVKTARPEELSVLPPAAFRNLL